MSEKRERVSAAKAHADLVATALAVGTGEVTEEPAPKAKTVQPEHAIAKAAVYEVLGREPAPEVVSEELEASAARGRANLLKAERYLIRGRDFDAQRRAEIDSYYEKQFGPEQPETQESASVPVAKNFAELVKGLSEAERDALLTEIYEADSADDEIVQALRNDEAIPTSEIPQPEDWTDDEREGYRQFMLDNHGVDVAYEDELGEGEAEADYESEANASSELDWAADQEGDKS